MNTKKDESNKTFKEILIKLLTEHKLKETEPLQMKQDKEHGFKTYARKAKGFKPLTNN